MTDIEIDAHDGDGWGVVEVRIKINGDEQPLTDKDAPYAFPVQLPKGTYELIAVAEDAAGLIAESPPVVLEIGVVEDARHDRGPDERDGRRDRRHRSETDDAGGDRRRADDGRVERRSDTGIDDDGHGDRSPDGG
jgi:hypothetical protein